MTIEPNKDSAKAAENAHPISSVDWQNLVTKIHGGDAAGMEELYSLFSRGIRYYLHRQLGPQELEDKVHDAFLIVVQAIRRGDLREPERLMGFVRTVVRRQVAAHIEQAVQSRRDFQPLDRGSEVSSHTQSPEDGSIERQEGEIMTKVLRSISGRDREILTRFYLLEQPQEQICAEMHLSETQFRLLKSRAKTRFGELGRKRVTHRTIPQLFLRKSAGSSH